MSGYSNHGDIHVSFSEGDHIRAQKRNCMRLSRIDPASVSGIVNEQMVLIVGFSFNSYYDIAFSVMNVQ
jgi:hypothetical protein